MLQDMSRQRGYHLKFIKSTTMKVAVFVDQEKQLSSKENIRASCKLNNVIAFDIFRDGNLIGSAMLREYEEGGYFLWNYAIDATYQNRNLGTTALKELISFMHLKYGLHTMTTTYIWGNEQARHVYEKVGFTETDIIDEPNCHEVNMAYSWSNPT